MMVFGSAGRYISLYPGSYVALILTGDASALCVAKGCDGQVSADERGAGEVPVTARYQARHRYISSLSCRRHCAVSILASSSSSLSRPAFSGRHGGFIKYGDMLGSIDGSPTLLSSSIVKPAHP